MKSKLVEVRIVAKRVAWQASGCIGRGWDGATGCGSGEGARRGAGAQGSSAGEAAHERCSARAPGAPSGLDGRFCAASAQAPGAGSAHLPLEPAHQSSRFRPRDDTHPLAFAGRLRGTDYILFILDLPQLFNYLIFQEKIGRGEGSKR